MDRHFLRKLVGFDYLRALADGSTLNILFKVAFWGDDETQALSFPVKSLNIIGYTGDT